MNLYIPIIALFIFLISSCSEKSGIGKYSTAHGDSLISKTFLVDYDKEAREVVANIVRYTGLLQNFEIVQSGISTAIAYNKGGKRYIAYNPLFIARVKDRTKTDWGAISVLAHEIGHHLLGHTLRKWKGDQQGELDADKFSGFILCRMGAKLEESKAAMSMIDLKEGGVYPKKTERLDAITRGWLEAKKLDDLSFDTDSAYRKVFEASDSVVKTDTLKKFVYKILFYGDRNYFFIDEKNQILSIDNTGRPFVVGYKVKSNDKSFDWTYVSDLDKEAYGVDFGGKIWKKTNTGELFVVGRVFNIH